MFIRAALLAALTLCAATVAAAQTGPRGTVSDRATVNSRVAVPTVVSSTITCGERLSYRVSVTDGSCSQYANPGPQGEAMPPDYARCQNSRGDLAVASCYRGCGPLSGSGQCVTIRDHR